jgi:hypothetical protein
MAKRKPFNPETHPSIRETTVGRMGRNFVIHCACGRDYPVQQYSFQGSKLSYCPVCRRRHSYVELVKGVQS